MNSVWFRNQIGTRIGLLPLPLSLSLPPLSDCVCAQTLKSLLTGCLVERVQTADTNPVSNTHARARKQARALQHTYMVETRASCV